MTILATWHWTPDAGGLSKDTGQMTPNAWLFITIIFSSFSSPCIILKNIYFIILVLLSAHIERLSISHMRRFVCIMKKKKTSLIFLQIGQIFIVSDTQKAYLLSNHSFPDFFCFSLGMSFQTSNFKHRCFYRHGKD